MSYRVEISSAAQRHLRRVRPEFRRHIETEIYKLADNPYPHGAVKLRGEERTWRIRVRQFRVLYEVYSDVLVVVVLKVARRNEGTYL